jgi:PAS domain S-box-containing protein
MDSSESLYQIWYELTSGIEDGIVILNTSDIICHLNKGISQLFPVTRENYVGRQFDEFIEEVVLPVIKNADSISPNGYHLISSTQKDQDLYIFSGPGKGQSVEFSILEKNDSDYHWKMGYFRRITRWKKTEELLIRIEERFRIIFENLFDSVAMYPVDESFYPGHFIEANSSSVKRLGYTQAELMRLSPADILPPEEFGRFLSFIKNFRISPVQTAEFSEVTKDGTIIPVEITALVVKIRNEEFIIQISRDISDRVKIRQLQMNAFEQINRNIEQFAILNDRIRNPLSVILTLASFSETPESTRIAEQVHIIDSLVDELDKGFIESEKVRKFLVRYFQADT